jgi:hypothetical protein
MERPPTARLRRIAVTATTVMLLLTLCFLPWAKHLRREASLLGDDTQRVEDLQLKPLSALLFRPFNEHLAPVFETVSWIAWQAAGRSVEHAAWTFTVASYLPFLLCVIGIGIVARRGFGSWTAAGDGRRNRRSAVRADAGLRGSRLLVLGEQFRLGLVCLSRRDLLGAAR